MQVLLLQGTLGFFWIVLWCSVQAVAYSAAGIGQLKHMVVCSPALPCCCPAACASAPRDKQPAADRTAAAVRPAIVDPAHWPRLSCARAAAVRQHSQQEHPRVQGGPRDGAGAAHGSKLPGHITYLRFGWRCGPGSRPNEGQPLIECSAARVHLPCTHLFPVTLPSC